MGTVEFYLTKTEPLTFKVGGMVDDEGQLPAFLLKDMIVTLVSGKWPLDDYRDCDRHTFVFQKDDGSQFSMLLTGFTYDCTWSKNKQQEKIDNGDMSIGISLVELNARESDDSMRNSDDE